MFASLRHLIGWVINVFRFRQDLMLENLGSVSNCWPCTPNDQGVGLHPAQVVLGDLAAALDGMEDSLGCGHAANGSRVASSGFSPLLEMKALKLGKGSGITEDIIEPA